MSNLTDEAVNDAKQGAKAVSSTVHAVKQGVKDAKVIGKAAGQAAAGNFAGAAATMVSHPKTLIKVIAATIVIALIPVLLLLFGFMFLTQIPGTIAETTMSALGETVDEVVLGLEGFKAQLSNGIDDFLTWITTGEKGDASQAYQDDIAIASDDIFQSYIGTSNVIVAVLNNYFRDAYTDYLESVKKKAQDEVEKAKKAAMSDPNNVTIDNITCTTDKDLYDGKNYLNWTFYIMAGDSYAARTDEGLSFRVPKMVEAARKLVKSKVWKTEVTTTTTYGKKTVTTMEPKMDEDGNPVFDEDGTIVMERVSKVVKTANIKCLYSIKPSQASKKVIMEYFNVPQDEDTVESDTSEADLFDEEAATMRQLYNAAEADFEGDSSLDIGAGDSTGGAGTGTVISGSIKQMIEQFYANHSDELFECPASGLLPGPWSGWKAKVTSSWQSPRGDTKHNGTDIVPPHSIYPMSAPFKGIIVGKQDGYSNGVLVTKGNGQRGNMLMIYYGERGGVVPGEKNGVFILYQHLSPGLSYNVDDTISAGAKIATTGYSGYCLSSHGGTGEHLHLELYYGETQKDPEIEMSN